jgi:hypothetical protein
LRDLQKSARRNAFGPGLVKPEICEFDAGPGGQLLLAKSRFRPASRNHRANEMVDHPR